MPIRGASAVHIAQWQASGQLSVAVQAGDHVALIGTVNGGMNSGAAAPAITDSQSNSWPAATDAHGRRVNNPDGDSGAVLHVLDQCDATGTLLITVTKVAGDAQAWAYCALVIHGHDAGDLLRSISGGSAQYSATGAPGNLAVATATALSVGDLVVGIIEAKNSLTSGTFGSAPGNVTEFARRNGGSGGPDAFVGFYKEIDTAGAFSATYPVNAGGVDDGGCAVIVVLKVASGTPAPPPASGGEQSTFLGGAPSVLSGSSMSVALPGGLDAERNDGVAVFSPASVTLAIPGMTATQTMTIEGVVDGDVKVVIFEKELSGDTAAGSVTATTSGGSIAKGRFLPLNAKTALLAKIIAPYPSYGNGQLLTPGLGDSSTPANCAVAIFPMSLGWPRQFTPPGGSGIQKIIDAEDPWLGLTAPGIALGRFLKSAPGAYPGAGGWTMASLDGSNNHAESGAVAVLMYAPQSGGGDPPTGSITSVELDSSDPSRVKLTYSHSGATTATLRYRRDGEEQPAIVLPVAASISTPSLPIGEYSDFRLTLSNANGSTPEMQDLTAIVINGPGPTVPTPPPTGLAPMITTSELPTAITEQPFSLTVTATGDTPISWTITDTPGTATPSFGTRSVTLTWATAPAVDSYSITFKADNDHGDHEVVLAFNVVEAPETPDLPANLPRIPIRRRGDQ